MSSLLSRRSPLLTIAAVQEATCRRVMKESQRFQGCQFRHPRARYLATYIRDIILSWIIFILQIIGHGMATQVSDA